MYLFKEQKVILSLSPPMSMFSLLLAVDCLALLSSSLPLSFHTTQQGVSGVLHMFLLWCKVAFALHYFCLDISISIEPILAFEILFLATSSTSLSVMHLVPFHVSFLGINLCFLHNIGIYKFKPYVIHG